MLKFAVTCLALLVGACNWTSQLDRDFAACVILTKTGGSCTATVPPTQGTTP